MNDYRKYVKVLSFSIISLLIYYYFENSDKVNAVISSVIESKSAYGFGYIILFNLLKYFLLLFGVVGIIFFFFKILSKED